VRESGGGERRGRLCAAGGRAVLCVEVLSASANRTLRVREYRRVPRGSLVSSMPCTPRLRHTQRVEATGGRPGAAVRLSACFFVCLFVCLFSPGRGTTTHSMAARAAAAPRRASRGSTTCTRPPPVCHICAGTRPSPLPTICTATKGARRCRPGYPARHSAAGTVARVGPYIPREGIAFGDDPNPFVHRLEARRRRRQSAAARVGRGMALAPTRTRAAPSAHCAGADADGPL
jgi:hypothetical protein